MTPFIVIVEVNSVCPATDSVSANVAAPDTESDDAKVVAPVTESDDDKLVAPVALSVPSISNLFVGFVVPIPTLAPWATELSPSGPPPAPTIVKASTICSSSLILKFKAHISALVSVTVASLSS